MEPARLKSALTTHDLPLGLDFLSLNDNDVRLTLPPKVFWRRYDGREEDSKEEEQRLESALRRTKQRWSWYIDHEPRNYQSQSHSQVYWGEH